MNWENGTDRLAQSRVARNLQFVKTTISVKHNKVKRREVRYACVLLQVCFSTVG